MKNMKFWRTALVATLVLTVMLSVTGGTIAWFTDEVTSSSNIIKSGKLDVELEYKAKVADEYQDASQGAIFNYQYWEPGYADMKFVKISNAGDLALKFNLNVKTNENLPLEGDGTEVNLAKVIDVYVFPADATVTRTDLTQDNEAYKGTVAELASDVDGAAHGVLLPAEGKGATDVVMPENTPKGEAEFCIVLKMQETAGNEYQEKSIGGDGFMVKLEATQFTYEKDSFDHLYDGEGEYVDPNLPKADIEDFDEEWIVDLYELDQIMSQNPYGSAKVDKAKIFKALDTAEEAALSPYAKWHADYVITFDNEVKVDSAGLAGNYGPFENIGFTAPQDIPANEEIRLLGTMGINFSYELLCDQVKEFKCGAFNLSDENIGTTMRVELRLYEPKKDNNNDDTEEETGYFIPVNSFEYTFEAPNQL